MQRRVFEVTAGWDDIEERELDPAALDRLTEIRVPTLVLVGPLDIEAVQQAARQALNDLDPWRHHDFRRYHRRHDDAAPCSPLRLRSGKDAGLLHRRTGHEGDRAPVDFTFPGAYFKRGGAEVHVVVEIEPDRTAQLRQKWSEEELRTGYVVHFALRVDSLDPYRRSLAERDLQPVGGPRIRADDVEQIYLVDPDGYVVELMCFHNEATANRRRTELAVSGEGVPIAPGHKGC